MDEIWRTISFGMGRKNDERIADHPVFDAIAHSPVQEQRKQLANARGQLGTVGGGNHYVDLFEDRSRRLIMGRGAFRLARARPQDGAGLPLAGVGRNWDERAERQHGRAALDHRARHAAGATIIWRR